MPGGGNYIADDLDSWLIGPLSILFKLNNGYIRQTRLGLHWNERWQFWLRESAHHWMRQNCGGYFSSIDKAEDEKTRGELDKELHTQIAKIADNPMIYSVLPPGADQLIENIIAGTRDYIMKKNRPEFKVDEQHRLLVEAIINNDERVPSSTCPSIWR